MRAISAPSRASRARTLPMPISLPPSPTPMVTGAATQPWRGVPVRPRWSALSGLAREPRVCWLAVATDLGSAPAALFRRLGQEHLVQWAVPRGDGDAAGVQIVAAAAPARALDGTRCVGRSRFSTSARRVRALGVREDVERLVERAERTPRAPAARRDRSCTAPARRADAARGRAPPRRAARPSPACPRRRRSRSRSARAAPRPAPAPRRAQRLA